MPPASNDFTSPLEAVLVNVRSTGPAALRIANHESLLGISTSDLTKRAAAIRSRVRMFAPYCVHVFQFSSLPRDQYESSTMTLASSVLTAQMAVSIFPGDTP